MNVDRCVSLHNKILQHGWIHSGKPYEELISSTDTWFNVYGRSAEAVRGSLCKELVQFLEKALVAPQGHAFFYYYCSLHKPASLFDMACRYEEMGETDPTRYVALYDSGNIRNDGYVGNPLGIYFDQQTLKARLLTELFDTDIGWHMSAHWYPLETVLEAWANMIQRGKVKAVEKEARKNYLYPMSPWVLVPFSESMVKQTVEAFDRLVDAIEKRMPRGDWEAEEIQFGLAEAQELEKSPIAGGFAAQFMEKARRPRFLYIAPGLEVLTPSFMICDQPFLASFDPSVRPPHTVGIELDYPPILLFRAGLRSIEKNPTPSNRGAVAMSDRKHFFVPCYKHDTHPAGLYFSCEQRRHYSAGEDAVRLITPFRIGAERYAQRGDGSNLDPWRYEGSHSQLYQPGEPAIMYSPYVRLVSVLENWIGMVESGEWEVGEEGVEGGIEKWRDADTEAKWDKYVIEPKW